MSTSNMSGKWAGAGVISAIAASLCCITPVLALIAGTSGIAAAFTWLEPARPYLIGLSIAVLAFAWYQRLRPGKAEIDCGCEDQVKPAFLQSKTFLLVVTVFAGAMLAFPYYSHLFYGSGSKDIIMISDENTEVTTYIISGMTCTSCEEHVKHAVEALPGIGSVRVSYEEGVAEILYDRTLSTPEYIKEAIDNTGYKVTDVRAASHVILNSISE
jgi:copper chaperone CopZ